MVGWEGPAQTCCPHHPLSHSVPAVPIARGDLLARQALVYTLHPNQQALMSCRKSQQVASLRPPSSQQFLLNGGAQIESSTAKIRRVLTFPPRQPKVKQPQGVLSLGSFHFVTSYVESHPETGGQCPPLSQCR